MPNDKPADPGSASLGAEGVPGGEAQSRSMFDRGIPLIAPTDGHSIFDQGRANRPAGEYREGAVGTDNGAAGHATAANSSGPDSPFAQTVKAASKAEGLTIVDKANTAGSISGSSQEILNHILRELQGRPAQVHHNYFHGQTQYVENAQGNASLNAASAQGNAPQPVQSSTSASGVSWPRSAFAACTNDANSLCFLVTCAVLDGESAVVIARYSQQLATRMLERRKRSPKGSDSSSAASRWDQSDIDASGDVSSRFEAFRVVEESSSSGRVDLRFVEPNARDRILRHAAAYLGSIPFWMADFSSWLFDLGRSQSPSIRHKAGATAAILSELAGTIDGAAFDAWVRDKAAEPTESIDAGFAFLLSAGSGCADEVETRLQNWADGATGGDGYYAVVHCAGNLTGTANTRLAFSMLRRMFNNSKDPGAQVWAARGLARVAWLSFEVSSRLPELVKLLDGCIADAAKQRDWQARGLVYAAARLAAVEGVAKFGAGDMTPFEKAISTREGREVLAPLFARMGSIAGVNVDWRELLSQLFRRAAMRGWPPEQEPFWQFYRSMFGQLDDPELREVWRSRVTGWLELAKNKSDYQVTGLTELMIELANG